MNTTIQKKYIDTGFGFPVHLLNVPMVKIRGQWTPNINYAELSSIVLQMLAVKTAKLTGNELKFIRNKFEMTLSEFGEKFYVTHPSVLKWENKKNNATKMNWATEKDIRLYICANSNEDNLVELYKQLRQQASKRKINTKVDVNENQTVLV